MKKYLRFQNDGPLDTKALFLMGASTKVDDDTKIGMFGSGWKYAIATFLRLNIDFVIISDFNHIQIEVVPTQFRDKTFDMIRIDGVDTNYTTSMGKDWELWMAIREVYCNCLDERHPVVSQTTELDALENKTIVYIEITDEVQEMIDNWMNYFAFERTDDVLEVKGKLKVYKKLNSDKSIIYRKGIKVAESEQKGCYDYDFYNIPINELRAAKDFSDVEDALRSAMLQNFNSEVIQTILSSRDTWEKDIHFYSWDTAYNKSAWVGAIGKSIVLPEEHADKFETEEKEGLVRVPMMMAKLIADNLPETTVLGYQNGGNFTVPVKPSEEKEQLIITCLDTALSIAAPLGIDREEFSNKNVQIKIVDFNGSSIRSMSDKKKSVISISHEIESEEDLTFVLFRELIMLNSIYERLTSSMENYLFRSLFDAYVKITNDSLI